MKEEERIKEEYIKIGEKKKEEEEKKKKEEE
jgi:hypothetical protein